MLFGCEKCEAEVGDLFDSINTASQFGNFQHIASYICINYCDMCSHN